MDAEPTSFKREMLSTLPSLRAFAVSLTGKHDKADDLVQDTVMKAWAKQSSFEMGTNIKAWLFTILRNEFYSQMRKRGREVQDTDGAFTERLSVHPSQYGSMDMQDFKEHWAGVRLAIVEVTLQRHHSFALIATLQSLGICVVLSSADGSLRHGIEQFPTLPVVLKPMAEHDLVQAIGLAISPLV